MSQVTPFGRQNTTQPGALRKAALHVASGSAFGLALLLVGCGGGSGGSASQGSGKSITLEQLPAELGAVYCEKAYDCCTAEERAGDFLLGGSASQGECADVFGVFAALAVAQIVDAENAGRLRYDPEAAGECFEQAKAASCTEYKDLENSEACSFGIIPLVPEGGGCTDNNECITGRCVGEDDGAEPPVLGACNAARGEGATCDTDSDCDSERCQYVDGESTCAAKLGAGSACSGASDCESGVCEADICVGGATQCVL
jgi:hypothetical protein